MGVMEYGAYDGGMQKENLLREVERLRESLRANNKLIEHLMSIVEEKKAKPQKNDKARKAR